MDHTSQDSRGKGGESKSGTFLLLAFLALVVFLIFWAGFITGRGCHPRSHVSSNADNSDEYEDDRWDRGRWIDVRGP